MSPQPWLERRFEIVFAQKLEQIRALYLHRLVRLALLVYQQRKPNAYLPSKSLSVGEVAKTDGCNCRTALSKFFFVGAQLRDMVAAEDSTVMAQEYDNCGLPQLKQTEAYRTPVAIGQADRGKPAVWCGIHGLIVNAARRVFEPQHSLCSIGCSAYLGNSGSQDAKVQETHFRLHEPARGRSPARLLRSHRTGRITAAL